MSRRKIFALIAVIGLAMMKKIAAIAVCLVLLLASWQLVIAQEKHKQSFTIPGEYRKYVTQNALDVQDIPGHQIRIFELHTIYPTDWPHKTAGLRPVKTVEFTVTDYVNRSGRHYGYDITIMENGDKTYSKIEGTTYTKPLPGGGARTTFTGIWIITGGTGKLSGIRGSYTYSGTYDPTKSLNEVTMEGEYWIE